MKPETYDAPKSGDEIATWTVAYMARLLDVPESQIDRSAPFERFGLDSMSAMTMIADLGDWIGSDLDPTLVYDYPTIDALAGRLAGDGGPVPPAAEVSAPANP